MLTWSASVKNVKPSVALAVAGVEVVVVEQSSMLIYTLSSRFAAEISMSNFIDSNTFLGAKGR